MYVNFAILPDRLIRNFCLAALSIATLLGMACAAHAQQLYGPMDASEARIRQLEAEVRDLKAARQTPVAAPVPNQAIEQLEAEVRALKAARQTPAAVPVLDPFVLNQLVDQRLNEKQAEEAAKKKAEQTQSIIQEVIVGADRKLNVTWDAGGFRFKSADGVFNLHMGGRLMTDEVWWTQSPDLRKSAVPPPGSNLPQTTGVGPGIGDLQDGFFVRRARFVADGTIFETIDFKIEFDFENYNSISFDESFVGARNLPWIGMVRIGQMHVPFGLEAYTSSRFLPMMERSPLFDAFYQEFAPGIFTNTTFFDERITTQHMFHRIDNFSQFNGASFGDGKYAYSGRISALPIYENAGRELLHLGFAYQFRKGSPPLDFNGGTTLPSNPNPALADNNDLIRFRARPSLRDAVGLQGDSARMIDTGNIIADHVQSINFEYLSYWGPFWIQSETNYSQTDNALFPASSGGTQRGNLNYWGTYFQTGFFLTGENRGYDKAMGKYARVEPLTNFYMVRDESGCIKSGPGAWEIVYRYAYVNLNDAGIDGGIYSEHTIGVNWYWNSNIKFQFNYINGQRSVPPGAASGNVQGFGLRAALEF